MGNYLNMAIKLFAVILPGVTGFALVSAFGLIAVLIAMPVGFLIGIGGSALADHIAP